jgi:putative transcriptional regulator
MPQGEQSFFCSIPPNCGSKEDLKMLSPGFLIAMPQLGDSNFYRSVILMLEHGETGSMGIVINRPAPLQLGNLADGQSLKVAQSRQSDPVFIGGPVEPHRGFVLHDCASIEEKHEVLQGLYLSITLDALRPLLQEEQCKLRFFLGYAGWGPKQLEKEISSGAWLFSDARANSTLEGDPQHLWDATLREMGVDPAMLVAGGGIQ